MKHAAFVLDDAAWWRRNAAEDRASVTKCKPHMNPAESYRYRRYAREQRGQAAQAAVNAGERYGWDYLHPDAFEASRDERYEYRGGLPWQPRSAWREVVAAYRQAAEHYLQAARLYDDAADYHQRRLPNVTTAREARLYVARHDAARRGEEFRNGGG